MPCFVTGSAEGDRRLHYEEEVTTLTQMLCATLKALEEAGGEVPANTKKWWKKHKVVDKKNKTLKTKKKLTCNKREYDCGDTSCVKHHSQCAKGGQCWHAKKDCKD